MRSDLDYRMGKIDGYFVGFIFGMWFGIGASVLVFFINSWLSP